MEAALEVGPAWSDMSAWFGSRRKDMWIHMRARRSKSGDVDAGTTQKRHDIDLDYHSICSKSTLLCKSTRLIEAPEGTSLGAR